MAYRTIGVLAAGLVFGVVSGVGTYSLTVTADSGAPGQSPSSQARTRYVVATIGDSLTDKRAHGGKFLSYLAKRCPTSRFDNYGEGGQMVNQMRHRFAREILGPSKPRYTHVIVYGGVNDLYSDITAQRTPAKISHDLSRMYDMARERGMKIIAINVSPWGGFTRYYNPRRGSTTLEVNRWIDDQKRLGKVDFVIDSYSMLSCGDPERLCPEMAAPFRDGIHFGPKGHEAIGKALYETIFPDCG